MKIRSVLILGATSFLLLLLVILGATIYLFASGSSDALYINLAGRQRMLSQKVAKEAFSYAYHPTKETLSTLERGITIFERSHRALRMTGMAPLSLDNTNDARVAGATDFALISKLDDVGSLWGEMLRNIRELEERADVQARALRTIEDESPRILAVADEVVALEVASRDISPRLVNVAGRQRMLSQKMGLDALLVQLETSPKARARLDEDMRLFLSSHRALRYGGDAQLNLNAPDTAFFPATSDPAVIRKLDRIEESWKQLEPAFGALTSEHNLNSALARVAEVNPRLLKTMDETVTVAQRLVDAKVRTFRNLQLATMAIALVILALSIWYSNRLGNSLARLRQAAEDISLGKLGARVQPVGTGEVKDLASSFERMRTSLQAAMLDVERREGLGHEL